MTSRICLVLAAVAGAWWSAAPAQADDDYGNTTPTDDQTPQASPPPVVEETNIYVTEPTPSPAPVIITPVRTQTRTVVREKPRQSPLGLGLAIGAGVADFTDDGMQSMTDPGIAWNATFTAGITSPLALELTYDGSAQNINSIGLDDNAMLVSNGIQAAGRVNLFPTSMVSPYAFAGVGFRRLDITNSDTNTSSVLDQDDLVQVPIGLGLGYRIGSALLDVRGTFRMTFDEDLAPDTTDQASNLPLNTWDATARAGFVF